MVQAALRGVMVRGLGSGALHGDDVRVGRAEHPACGDEVVLYVRLVAGVLQELRWQAMACPATTAVAALAAEVLPGLPHAQLEPRLRAEILRHGGLASHERHAEGLVLRALLAAAGS